MSNILGTAIVVWGSMGIFIYGLPHVLDAVLWYYDRRYKQEVDRSRALKVADRILKGEIKITNNAPKEKKSDES